MMSKIINFFHSYVVNFSVAFQTYFLFLFLLKFYTGFYHTTLAAELISVAVLYFLIYFLAYFIYGLYSFTIFSVSLEGYSGLSKKDYRSKNFFFYTFFSSLRGFPLSHSLIACLMMFFVQNISVVSVFIKMLSTITIINGMSSVVCFDDWFLLKFWVCFFPGLKLIDIVIQLCYRTEYGSKLLYEITDFTGSEYLNMSKFYVKDGKLVNKEVGGSQLFLSITNPLFGIKSYFPVCVTGPFICSLMLELFYLIGIYPGSFLRVVFYSSLNIVGL